MTGGRARAITTTSLFHTLFNDFASEADGTTYVQTGDIPAMWLRDSSAQAIPYIRFQPAFPVLRDRFAGVIERNARNILTDPYANAFTPNYRVWERKWEVDSLAWPVIAAWVYWQQTSDRRVFTKSLHDALRKIVQTYECEQDHQHCSRYAYQFRVGTSYNYAGGTGMIWCAFRPSDDAVMYRYNIPQEMSAVLAVHELSALAQDGWRDNALATRAAALAAQVQNGIQRYGRTYDPRYGWLYAYETDGEGHVLMMDDANTPDLLAMPLFAFAGTATEEYQAVRRFALSRDNPYYFHGRYANGLGSPHTPYGWVWPLGMITRARTSTSVVETRELLTELAETDSEEGLLHESFDPNAFWRYTRAQFGWANASYAELIFGSLAGFPPYQLEPPQFAQPFSNQDPQSLPLADPQIQFENALRITEALSSMLHLVH